MAYVVAGFSLDLSRCRSGSNWHRDRPLHRACAEYRAEALRPPQRQCVHHSMVPTLRGANPTWSERVALAAKTQRQQPQSHSFDVCWGLARERGFSMINGGESETGYFRQKVMTDCMAGKIK
jgi:hypothetical protein